MRLTDLLALSHVPRWSITSVARTQTVADHTFRVMAIAMELATRVGVELKTQDFIRILCHDGHESWTADLPSPVKKEMEEMGIDFNKVVPWMKGVPAYSTTDAGRVASIADKIEAYTFISKYGQGEQAARIGRGCLVTIHEVAAGDQNWKRAVGSVILDVMQETGRGFESER